MTGMQNRWWANPQANKANDKRFWPHLFKKDLEHRITQAKKEGKDRVPLGEITLSVGKWIMPSIKVGRYDKTFQLVNALASDPSSHLLVSHPEVGMSVTEGLLKACVVGATKGEFDMRQRKTLIANSIKLLSLGGKKELLVNLAHENFENMHIVPGVLVEMACNRDWEAIRRLLENDAMRDGHRELGRQLLTSKPRIGGGK